MQARSWITAIPTNVDQSVLRIDRAAFAYAAHPLVFGDVSVDVRQGERVAIMGGSGSGKTTLLKLAAGLKGYQPGSGEVNRAGRAVMVFQQPLLLSYLTVEQNIFLPMRFAGEQAPSDQVLETLELRPLLKRYPYEISGGQQRRVSLARALLSPDAACLILDEALTGLDEPLKERILDQLSAYLSKTGLACLFATHSSAEAAFLATRVLFLGDAPARILDEKTVDLPLDRGPEIRESQAYFREISEIRRLVHKCGAV